MHDFKFYGFTHPVPVLAANARWCSCQAGVLGTPLTRRMGSLTRGRAAPNREACHIDHIAIKSLRYT